MDSVAKSTQKPKQKDDWSWLWTALALGGGALGIAILDQHLKKQKRLRNTAPCPVCGHRLTVEATQASFTTVECPNCRTSLRWVPNAA